MEERKQQLENIKDDMLSRILDQSARARCNIFYIVNTVGRLIITFDLVTSVNSEHALSWQARERKDGKRNAFEHDRTWTIA